MALLFPTRINPSPRDAFYHADHKILWWCLWTVFLLAFWASLADWLRSTNVRMLLCGIETAIIMYLCWLQPGSTLSVTFIIICWQVALLFTTRVAVTWIALQGALHLCINLKFSPTEFMNTLSHIIMFSFNSSTAVIVLIAKKEIDLRTAQALSNVQLKATQELLEESSRSHERLRISRELHDAIGHRLTALYLHLELAMNRSDEPEIRQLIQKGQIVSQDLLTDVRDVVRKLRDTSGVELTGALNALATDLPGLKVHLDAPLQLTIDDSDQANALIRCVQEIITNTLKHSGASQLWVKLTISDNRVIVTAHDNGVAKPLDDLGLGLRGMKERFLELGGNVDVVCEPGGGLSVRALLPIRESHDHSRLN